MELNRPVKILVAPMNWGLGHATRDIPVIGELLRAGAEVVLAGDGRSLELLRKEFPELSWIKLKGHDIRYQHKGSLTVQMLTQLPKIICSIFNEHRQLKRIISEEKIDAVISDNRFGLFSKDIYAVFITHQLYIRLPKNIRYLEKAITRLNKTLMGKFDECWVPDWEGSENLSGSLSHYHSKPQRTTFIGPLSRLHHFEIKKEFDLLFLLSGPEPQRTVFENIIRREIERKQFARCRMMMIRGVTEGTREIRCERDQLFITDFQLSAELNRLILSSDMIISRPGYSTIMDLATLGKKAIFIPTPGQPEQEYLAEYFKSKNFYYSCTQKTFDLVQSIETAKNYHSFSPVSETTSMLAAVIEKMLKRANKRNVLNPRSIPAPGGSHH